MADHLQSVVNAMGLPLDILIEFKKECAPDIVINDWMKENFEIQVLIWYLNIAEVLLQSLLFYFVLLCLKLFQQDSQHFWVPNAKVFHGLHQVGTEWSAAFDQVYDLFFHFAVPDGHINCKAEHIDVA